jgi:adenine deaminase
MKHAMTDTPPIATWAAVAADLVAVAAGRAPADVVIRNCAWVNVHSREVIPGSDCTRGGKQLLATRQRDSRRRLGAHAAGLVVVKQAPGVSQAR